MANKKVKIELTAINKTKAAFTSVTGGLKSIGGAAAGATKGIAAVGLAATAAAGALALIVNKSFDAVDALGKTSTQTGIATDTLQAFHLAARESGTTVEGANTALIKFARSVGDASRGLKTQADIFKDLGVELKDTNGNMKSFDTLLVETAKGVSNMADQTTRAAALAGLFGRQGVVLTGAIKDLSNRGLKDFVTRAKELGIVLSEKVIRRTEQFNDAVGVIKMQLGSFVNNITTSFLPVFEKMQETISKKIKQIVDDAGGMDALGLKIANGIIDGVAGGIQALGDLGDNIFRVFTDIRIKLKETEIQFLEFQKALMSIMPRKFADELGDLELRLLHNDVALKDLNKETSNFGEQAEVVANKVRGYKLSLSDLTDGAKDAADEVAQAGNVFTDLLSPTEKFMDQLKDVNTSIENAAVASMKKFEDTIMDGLKAGKFAFEDFATFVVEQLLRIAIQQMIIAPMAKAMFGSIPTFDGGGYTGMGSRAGGVDGKGGFPAVLHPNETVVDHTKGQGNNAPATVNFNISTVDAAGFDQLLTSRKGLITSIINNAMNNQGKMGVV